MYRLTQTIVRFYLWIRYRLLSRRYNRLVLEWIGEVPLIVLPQVFNPVLLRTGRFMVETLQATYPNGLAGQRVLDLGTGSGVGAVFAGRLGAEVVAVDINPHAVRCARLNGLLNRVPLTALQGDLLSALPAGQFDLMLFNPPFYVGQPQDALDHAWRGQNLFERFVADLSPVLAPQGVLWLLLSSDGDGQHLLRLLTAAGFTCATAHERDFINEIVTVYRVTRKNTY